ncbi:hypothetical protein [Longispora urticae]
MNNDTLTMAEEIHTWFTDGLPYDTMTTRFHHQTGVRVPPAGWAAYRESHDLPHILTNLVPWQVEPIHQFHLILTRLRDEERRRAGEKLDLETLSRVRDWGTRLRAHGLVVSYDPATEQGFSLVPARPGVDTDLVRVP